MSATIIGAPAAVPASVPARPPQSPGRLAVARFLGRPAAVAGLFVVVVFFAVAAFAPLIAPYDPVATSWSLIRKAPSWAHWMGTDENGRDVLSRVIFGSQASLMAGVLSVSIAAGIGVPVGLLAGFAGGKTDAVIGRLVDAMLACPFLILAIALAAFLGPSLENAMIAIGITAAPVFMRISAAPPWMRRRTNMSRRRARSAIRPGGWHCATCCPTSCRPFWCRPRSPSPGRSSPRPACPFSASASSRRRRPGAAC